MNPTKIPKMLRGQSYKSIVAFYIDITLVIIAGMLGLYLRLGDRVFGYPNTFLIDHVIILIFSTIIANFIIKIYKNVWRFFNLDYLSKIVKFASLVMMIFLLMQFFDSRLEK